SEGRVFIRHSDSGAGAQANRSARSFGSGENVMASNLSPTSAGPGTASSAGSRLAALFAAPRTLYPILAALFAIFALAPLGLNNYYIVILTNAFLYVVLALGLNVVV